MIRVRLLFYKDGRTVFDGAALPLPWQTVRDKYRACGTDLDLIEIAALTMYWPGLCWWPHRRSDLDSDGERFWEPWSTIEAVALMKNGSTPESYRQQLREHVLGPRGVGVREDGTAVVKTGQRGNEIKLGAAIGADLFDHLLPLYRSQGPDASTGTVPKDLVRDVQLLMAASCGAPELGPLRSSISRHVKRKASD